VTVPKTLDSAVASLPLLPPPGTALISEHLLSGSYALRHVTLYEVAPHHTRWPAVINYSLMDRGKLFGTIVKLYLAPLRILRGVDLKFDKLTNIGGKGRQRYDIINGSGVSTKEALHVFKILERMRIYYLRELADHVSPHA
jgi:hypothetical protein